MNNARHTPAATQRSAHVSLKGLPTTGQQNKLPTLYLAYNIIQGDEMETEITSKYIPEWDKTIIQVYPKNPTKEFLDIPEYITGWYGQLTPNAIANAVAYEMPKIVAYFGLTTE